MGISRVTQNDRFPRENIPSPLCSSLEMIYWWKDPNPLCHFEPLEGVRNPCDVSIHRTSFCRSANPFLL
jgi:hypothetical protein